jgi:hypothetical protein
MEDAVASQQTIKDFGTQLEDMLTQFLLRQAPSSNQGFRVDSSAELWKQYKALQHYQVELRREQGRTVGWINQAAHDVQKFKDNVEEAYSAHVAETSAHSQRLGNLEENLSSAGDGFHRMSQRLDQFSARIDTIGANQDSVITSTKEAFQNFHREIMKDVRDLLKQNKLPQLSPTSEHAAPKNPTKRRKDKQPARLSSVVEVEEEIGHPIDIEIIDVEDQAPPPPPPPKGSKRQRSPSSSPSDSGNSDSSDGSDPRKRYKRRGTTPPRRPSETPYFAGPTPKETPCPDPPKYDMKKGKDYRAFLRGCERFINLKIHRFPSEKNKILWALGFLDGEKAQIWAESYETKMSKHTRYKDWEFFKAKLRQECDLAEEDVDSITKMEEWSYKGDITTYIDKLKFLNDKAKLSGGGLKRVIRRGLPEKIIDHMSLFGDPSTTEALWTSLKKAGKAYEIAVQAKKSIGLGGSSTGGSSGNSSVPKKNESQGDNTTKNPTPPKKDKAPKAPEGTTTQDSTVASAEKRQFPQRFASYEEAIKGVPKDLAQKRSDAKSCGRCGKKHKTTHCASDIVTKDTKVAATSSSTAPPKPEPTPKVEPTVSAVSQSNHGFIREYDSDELDLWTDDGQGQSAR